LLADGTTFTSFGADDIDTVRETPYERYAAKIVLKNERTLGVIRFPIGYKDTYNSIFLIYFH
jgi:hypothetical protein